jgi:hypothetical protein
MPHVDGVPTKMWNAVKSMVLVMKSPHFMSQTVAETVSIVDGGRPNNKN